MFLRLTLLLVLGSLAYGKTAMLDGHTVYYEATGRGTQTLVLIHGWTCNHTFWEAQIPAFSAKYKVLAIDLPGHGKSAAAADYTMQRMARAVDAVMRKEKAARATLIGHSMGGAVVLQFARLFPAKLERVVLVDAVVIDPAALQGLAGFVKQFEGPGVRALREKLIGGMFSDATTPAVLEAITRGMLEPPDAVASGAAKGMASPDVWQFSPTSAPTLALIAPSNKDAREEVSKVPFPKLTFRRMESGGHFFMMETPEPFNRIVLDWLAAH